MNIFTENVEKCACRICFSIDKVEDTSQYSYNGETMFDIVNIVLKLPQAASNYLEKLCMNCLKTIINVHLFVRKLNDRKTFWEKAVSSPRACSQTIALPTDNYDGSTLYDQNLLRINEVSIKNEEIIDCRNADSEHVEYELIIKGEGVIDADDQPDYCDVHNDNNDDYSNLDNEDNLPLSYTGVNRVPQYQEEYPIVEGDSEPVTKKSKCDAGKEASIPTQAKSTKKLVPCKECGKMYGKRTIKSHMLLHKTDKSLQCNICEYVGSNFTLSKHVKRYHDQLAEPLTCQVCDSVHHNVYDFKEHLKIHDQKYRAHSLNIIARNACHKCGKTYFFADSLVRHIRTHDEKSDLWCKHCQKGFSSNFGYQTHMRSHTGEKPNACPYCPKRFTQKRNLENHLKMHDNKREYRCEFCVSTFNIKQSLEDHRRMHTGDKHKCQFCDRHFAHISSLYRHIRRVHPKRQQESQGGSE